ncbi:hypothetical protein IEO21_09955 [Rhodonia placenta]|uniref:Uncharacterized protein n=1 Tax=Rhodonia placenta TaxID=104341 RepID=A0A8H7NTD4_9APHY|nr:hypothetical protein IEO21_09955 [Postia placenta]
MAPQSTSHAGVFLESEWIGSGKKFTKDLPAYVKTALEAELSLPPAILSLVLPLPNATVHTILLTSFPLISNETNLSSQSTFHFFSMAASSHPQLALLRTLAIPDQGTVNTLLKTVGNQWLDGRRSITCHHLKDGSAAIPFPLFMLTLWKQLHALRPHFDAWSASGQWLSHQQQWNGSTNATADAVRMLLHDIPWSKRLHGFHGAGEPDV